MTNKKNEIGMIKPNILNQTRTLIKLGLYNELKNKEKMLSPFIFGAIILIMFSFATGEIEKELKIKFFTAELILTVLLSLSIYFIRAFEIENEDGVFNKLRSTAISRNAWFFSKLFIVSALSFATASLVMLMTSAFVGISNDLFLPKIPSLIAILALAIIGLSAVGIILSAVTLKARGRSIVFSSALLPTDYSYIVSLDSINKSFIFQRCGSFFLTMGIGFGRI